MTEEYIYLSSDVNPYFDKGSISNFTTILDKRHDLEGEWEIALTEISFTYSFYNVTVD